MLIESWLLFFSIAFFSTLLPGPSATLVLAHGSRYGFRKSLYTITGINLAVLLLMLVSTTSIGAFLHTVPEAQMMLRVVSASFLIFIAVMIWRDTNHAINTANNNVANTNIASNFKLLGIGFVTSLSNPKALVFFFALFPQFITENKIFSYQFLILIGTWLVCEVGWLIVYALSGQKLSEWLAEHYRRKILQRVCALILLISALLLGLRSGSVDLNRYSPIDKCDGVVSERCRVVHGGGRGQYKDHERPPLWATRGAPEFPFYAASMNAGNPVSQVCCGVLS